MPGAGEAVLVEVLWQGCSIACTAFVLGVSLWGIR